MYVLQINNTAGNTECSGGSVHIYSLLSIIVSYPIYAADRSSLPISLINVFYLLESPTYITFSLFQSSSSSCAFYNNKKLYAIQCLAYYYIFQMGRSPCCEKVGLKKGPWTPEEDQKLLAYIEEHGHGSWRALPQKAGNFMFILYINNISS